jgi:proline iminopeptidase
MHGGPGLDHWSLQPFRRLADQFTLVFYDHRCNGRSDGAPVDSMTWDNLTADAEALRIRLGYERWAVLGHSFGGNVALEYALRYPESLSHLILLDTGGDARWPQENAARLLLQRGWSAERAELVRRWFNGEFEPRETLSLFLQIGDAYSYRPSRIAMARAMLEGQWRMKMRPETMIYAGRHLVKGWTVMDRLGEIHQPTLVMAGRADFIFPPACQAELAGGIPNARLQLIERAGHNPHWENPEPVFEALSSMLRDANAVARPEALVS